VKTEYARSAFKKSTIQMSDKRASRSPPKTAPSYYLTENVSHNLNYIYIGLYLMVYCRYCQINVHWNCIGTDKELVRKYRAKKAYYFFECDRCKCKEAIKENPENIKVNFYTSYPQPLKHDVLSCIACESSKGLMKSFEIEIEKIQHEEDEEMKD
jgi:hypothetical protein